MANQTLEKVGQKGYVISVLNGIKNGLEKAALSSLI